MRRRIQQQTYGHRGRADDTLSRIRRVLRRGAAHLTDTGWARLMAGMDAVDEGGQVAATWVAAQELRAIYRCRDRDDAGYPVLRLDGVLHRLCRSRIALNGPHDHHLPHRILAYFIAGPISNGPIEAINLLIKKTCASATASGISTTIGYACCTAESPGKITRQYHYAAGYHAWLRRAPNLILINAL